MYKNTSFLNFTKVLLSFLILLISNISAAQAPVWEWAKEFKGIIASSPNGDIYTTGGIVPSSVLTLGSQTLANTTDKHMLYLAKFDNDANCLWIKKVGSGTLFGGYGSGNLRIDTSGNFYITGEFKSSITFNTVTLTNNDPLQSIVFIAKFDPLGNIIWAKKIVKDSMFYGVGLKNILCDANNNTYVAGYFDSPTASFENITLTKSGKKDIFLAKYDSNGNISWVKQIKGETDLEFTLAIDSTNNLYFAGDYISESLQFENTTINKSGSSSFSFLAKYNDAGTLSWVKNYACDICSIAIDNEDKLCITGSFNYYNLKFGEITLTNTQPGSADVFTTKFDSNGAVIWAKKVTAGPSSEGSTTIINDNENNIYISGTFQGPYAAVATEILTCEEGQRNVFIAKYDTNGNPAWVKSSSGSYNIDSTLLLANDNLFLMGIYTTNITFDATTLIATQETGHEFLAKVKQNTLNQKEFAKSTVTIYPNPAQNILNISSDLENINSYVIVDIMGRIVKNGIIYNNTINVETLPQGLYILNIANKTGIKFIKK